MRSGARLNAPCFSLERGAIVLEEWWGICEIGIVRNNKTNSTNKIISCLQASEDNYCSKRISLSLHTRTRSIQANQKIFSFLFLSCPIGGHTISEMDRTSCQMSQRGSKDVIRIYPNITSGILLNRNASQYSAHIDKIQAMSQSMQFFPLISGSASMQNLHAPRRQQVPSLNSVQA